LNTPPKSLRPHIGFFGRTNTGKSSLLNLVAGQDVAITSPVPGTTTDVVEKAMELLPIGPVVLMDTAGLDDASELGARRRERTAAAMERADVVVVVAEPGAWGAFEEEVVASARARKAPVLAVVNKTDLAAPDAAQIERIAVCSDAWMAASCVDPAARERIVVAFKERLLRVLPEDAVRVPPIVADLLPPGGLAVLVVPIDLQAPKGRLILPQVQTIRDALDGDAAALVVKERELSDYLARLTRPPDLVVCDSQAVLKAAADTPPGVPFTTFSILMARAKGDLVELARGAAAIPSLRAGSRVLVAEACTHHALEDDIGRVKIPRWLRQFAGVDLSIDHVQGRDYPAGLAGYDLVIHCGACMLTRREMLGRIARAREAGVPITNYGLAISVTQGVIGRVLAPFPAAAEAWRAGGSSKFPVSSSKLTDSAGTLERT
jgi:[FeFe] hydrogenase H-cluster maturation GTPase HydF